MSQFLYQISQNGCFVTGTVILNQHFLAKFSRLLPQHKCSDPTSQKQPGLLSWQQLQLKSMQNHHGCCCVSAGKGNQGSFGFSSSLALFNPSFMKGQPAHHEGFNLLQEAVTACSRSWERPSVQKVDKFLGEQVVMSHT